MSHSQSGTYVSQGEGESVWLVGDLITVKVASEDTDGAFAIVEESTPPQGGPPPHLHQQAGEVLNVLEGEVEFLVGERTIRGARGRAPTFTSRPSLPTSAPYVAGRWLPRGEQGADWVQKTRVYFSSGRLNRSAPQREIRDGS